MEYENYLNEIIHYISVIQYEVENRGSIHLYDINIFCEKIFCEVLNQVYSLNLKESNLFEKNNVAFDLNDNRRKLVYQVTSQTDSKKIKHTIEEFIKNNLHKKYKKLKVLLLKKKPNFTTTFDTKGLFNFDTKEDIIDIKNICDDIFKMEPNKIFNLHKKLKEFFDIAKPTVKYANEEETIIHLINIITESTEYVEDIGVIVDPEFKINKRFKEYSDYIKSEFIECKKIYGSKLDEVINSYSKTDKIKLCSYLKNMSIKFLDDNDNNPKQALNKIVDFFSEMLKKSNLKFDDAAIRYFIVYEIIQCNIFPNVKGVEYK